MSTFSYVRNLIARVGQASSKHPRIVWGDTLKGTFFGLTITGAIDGLAYLINTSGGACTYNQYINDHAKDFGCTASGDPCNNGWVGFTGLSVKPTLSSSKDPVNPDDGTSDNTFTYTCPDGYSTNQLTNAASAFFDAQVVKNTNNYLGTPGDRKGGYHFTVSFPIIGSVVGFFAGLVWGVQRAEAEMKALGQLQVPLLEEARGPRDLPVASTNPSGFHSPNSPRNNPSILLRGAPVAETRVEVQGRAPGGPSA